MGTLLYKLNFDLIVKANYTGLIIMENDKSSQEIRSIASPGQEWHIEGYIPPKTCLFLSKK